MGNSNKLDIRFNSKSTAKQVIDGYSNGQQNYLNGKTIIVTGGNSGIGLETCKAFAYGGARVILCSRNVQNAQKIIEQEVIKEGEGKYIAPKNKIIIKQLDLESLQSIKQFADNIIQSEERIDYLILNAGIMALPELKLTENKWEAQLATNHFGHFYLTSLLLDKMINQSFKSRIVVVSSLAHKYGTIKLEDLHFVKGRSYNDWKAYGQSKLANILFAKELNDRLQESTKGKVIALCLHPGVIATNLARNLGSCSQSCFKTCFTDKSIPQGASNQVFACLCPQLEQHGGAYLDNCDIAVPTKESQDVQLRKKFWLVTEQQIQEALNK